jgi:hypothetical protein
MIVGDEDVGDDDDTEELALSSRAKSGIASSMMERNFDEAAEVVRRSNADGVR